MVYRLNKGVLEDTFKHFHTCGQGRQECQVLWLSPWGAPQDISKVVHPRHKAHLGGFELDDQWISDFWLELGNTNMGIRVQLHTHPLEAFHSEIDDAFPIIHKPGFLSLVIPNFGLGPVGLDEAYLTEIQSDGQWQEVAIASRLVLT